MPAELGSYRCRRIVGFTLVELMIVVVIISLIAAIAYPSYRQYVLESRRETAKSALMEAAQQLERCYSSNSMSYLSSPSAATSCATLPSTTKDGTYNINLESVSEDAFELEAVPQGTQANDDCGTLGVEQDGTKEATGSATVDECW